MSRIELQTAAPESLSVRSFSIREALSNPFDVRVIAVSPHDELDLDTLVGHPAALHLEGEPRAGRGRSYHWTGVCRSAEQVEVESTGLSTYEIRLAPTLWLLSQRHNYRIFQHISVPDIVRTILHEWEVSVVWKVDAARYPKVEYRVQYGESDLAFVSRLLEEVGITYLASAREGGALQVVCDDAPAARDAFQADAVAFVENAASTLDKDWVTRARLHHELRSAKVALRDHDFRRPVNYKLLLQASGVAPADERLERFRYAPGISHIETEGPTDTPVADQHGVARADERVARARLDDELSRELGGRRTLSFLTNVLDLAAGCVFSVADHPRPDLADDKRLLVVERVLEGTHDGAWSISAKAVFADSRYVPKQVTPKPQIHGVQSAVVVGPTGQAIHTDEHGRVRAQFHWDRHGVSNDHSSCWIRVSQGWAGGGYGMMMIPRVGQEVLVGFFEGDPDQPVIVGRMFNASQPVPYKLPDNKTVSTWKSESTPGSNGFNEIRFEDARGAELVYMQAERDLQRLVKVNESITVGANRTKVVGVNETETTGVDRTVTVGVNRTTAIGAVDASVVGVRHSVTMAQLGEPRPGVVPTGTEMVDRKITLTTGEATITLEGPNITLDAAASILLSAAADITITGRANIKVLAGAAVRVEAEGGDLVVQGGPMVRINPVDKTAKQRGEDEELPVQVPDDVDFDDNLDEAEDHAQFDPETPNWFEQQTAPGGAWDPERWGPEHRDFGNFHLGVMGAAAGMPRGLVLRLAGKRHQERHGKHGERGDPGNGIWGGKAPFGNEPRNYEAIREGFDYYGKNYV